MTITLNMGFFSISFSPLSASEAKARLEQRRSPPPNQQELAVAGYHIHTLALRLNAILAVGRHSRANTLVAQQEIASAQHWLNSTTIAQGTEHDE